MITMTECSLVFLGAGAGGLARHLLSRYVDTASNGYLGSLAGLPVGTIAVNIIGSTLIGFLAIWIGQDDDRIWLKWLLMAGLMGGFTTFSSFSLQTVQLLQSGRPLLAGGNIGLSLVACILGTLIGLWLAKAVSSP